MKTKIRKLVTIIFFLANVLVYSQTKDTTRSKTDDYGEIYAGYSFDNNNNHANLVNIGLKACFSKSIPLQFGVDFNYGLNDIKSVKTLSFLSGIGMQMPIYDKIYFGLSFMTGLAVIQQKDAKRGNYGIAAKAEFEVGYGRFGFFASMGYLQSQTYYLEPKHIGFKFSF
jgi:hypothetical protein